MKSFLAALVLFSFLSFVELSDARKEPREYYWKSMMKDEPMPEAIKELFVEDPAGAGKLNHFVKDFDTRHSAIIYHSHAEKDRLKERKSTNARDHDGDTQ
ncbi:PROTEIN putative-RELATED [Salix koriyanagi]|uniref:PROTEIN putative-RELATED n=1 Tax=Salix koriyanagi TaxID=2511006 RepID=A0A9Q0ZLQ2_9ROSI|nr:PROTEIN putative-RELATED [Salix koriyanagi]